MSGFSVPMSAWLYQGLPASSGTVSVYQTGTTTPVTVYSDGGLTTPITNPVTLNSDGYAVFYVANSTPLRLDGKTSTGTLIKSIDPVYPVNDLTGLTSTATELNYLHGVTPGTALASHAVVLDSGSNVTALATNTYNTYSTGIANMAAVQGSQIGGYINKFRNPGMDICQRATSGTITAGSPTYTVDGWIVSCTGANVTWNQQGGAGISIGNAGSLNSLLITGNAAVTGTTIKQRIEGIIAAQLSGQTVTYQAYINNQTTASFTPTLTIKYSNASDNWGGTTTVVNAVSLQPCANGVWTKVSYTFSNASYTSSAGLEATLDVGGVLNTNIKYMIFTQADIRVTSGVTLGLNSNPPIAEIRSYPSELTFNQRYLAAFGDIVGVIGHGAATSTSASGYIIPFKVPLRAAPTALSVTTVGNFEIATFAAVDVAATTGLTFSSAGSSNQHAFVTASVTGTPLTSAVSYYLYTKTALQGNLLFSAEL